VYYLPLPMLHLATSIARPNLVSMGTCFGKFSKSGKFKLGVTCLDWIAQYAKYKVGEERSLSSMQDGGHRIWCGGRLNRVSAPGGTGSYDRSGRIDVQVWIKQPGELPFLYGNHVVKAHLGRITEDTPEHQGVVVYNMADMPLVSCGIDRRPTHAFSTGLQHCADLSFLTILLLLEQVLWWNGH